MQRVYAERKCVHEMHLRANDVCVQQTNHVEQQQHMHWIDDWQAEMTPVATGHTHQKSSYIVKHNWVDVEK